MLTRLMNLGKELDLQKRIPLFPSGPAESTALVPRALSMNYQDSRWDKARPSPEVASGCGAVPVRSSID